MMTRTELVRGITGREVGRCRLGAILGRLEMRKAGKSSKRS